MNINNNPNYTCVTSSNNPYVDAVSFKPAASVLAKQMQTSFLIDRLSCVTGTVPYILTIGGGKPAPFYTQIMDEVATCPTKYNCTEQELRRAYGITFEIISAIGAAYNKTKTINDAIFKYGVILLNNKFYEDASNNRVNKSYFVDGIKKMSADLNKYRNIILQKK